MTKMMLKIQRAISFIDVDCLADGDDVSEVSDDDGDDDGDDNCYCGLDGWIFDAFDK